MKNLLKFSELQLLVIIAWLALFSLNEALTSLLPYKDYIALIFLPAGFKIICACLLRWQCFLGLFIGSIITGLIYLNESNTHHLWVFSFFSALMPIIVVLMIDYLCNLGFKLSEINLQKIILIAVLYALLSSVMHNSYLLWIGEISLIEYQQDSLAMFIGDMTGTLIFLTVLSYYRAPLIKIANKYL